MRATEFITEQENPKVDLTPNYPNYQVLVGEFVGVKKNRLLFKILSAELKPGQGSTEKIFRAMTTNTPIGIEVDKVKNRKVVEDLSRRGFLGGLGATALGVTDVAQAKLTQPTPQKSEPINMLSNHPQHEAVLQRAAKAAGIKGTELAQFMAQTNHESWDFSRLKEKGIVFAFENLNKRILWDDEAGFESGVIFSGKQSKGEALQYFLEKIAHWKPKHIIFVDDNPEYLNSMSSMCNRLKIKFTGFHYKAAVFDQDEELSPEIARLQLKTLDEKEIWIPDSEAKKIIEEGKK